MSPSRPSQPDQPLPTPPENLVRPFSVVGIGASAGGLEAFSQLLDHLPVDTGMAFVLVQHLDPNHKSLLSEILGHRTAMPVQEAQEGMAVTPNQVYVIPPNTLLTLGKGQLHLSPREPGVRVSKAVDTFLNSLAQDWGDRAIAVILSGGDSDGSQGLEAVKAAGGITFAQSQNSAQVSKMPGTAIATGQVDFVLSPVEIAAELARISRHPYITQSRPENLDVSPMGEEDRPLPAILSLIQAKFRVDFGAYKRNTLQRRILRRMALYHLDRMGDYVTYLQAHPEEVNALYEEILIHVTSFFRDGEAFEALKQEVFPALLRNRPIDIPLRMWVAGCSTGEEAYSLAICLLEFLAHQPRPPQIQIFATDISELVIEKARTGIYLPSQVSDISADRLQRFFVPIDGGYQINKIVRELCIFARQNLCSDPPFSRLDLISCRNVLIYFGTALQKKVLPTFHYGLKPNGFLLLGSAETVGDFSQLFHLVSRQHKIYIKQPATPLLSIDVDRSTPSAMVTTTPGIDQSRSTTASLSDLVDEIVLNHYAPVGVVINNHLQIVQFRGQTGPYLEPSPGLASLNVLTMVREELRIDLRTLLHQARQTGQTASQPVVTLKDGDPWQQIRLDVVPVQPPGAIEDYFLILFTPIPGPPHLSTGTPSVTDLPAIAEAEIQRLQKELETNKAYLQSIIQEQESRNQDLRAANEEILSSNEELQSTNEELQTAKEEIQATNEELSTINDELYRRNSETMEVSNDFQNLLASINIPILMLEGDLRIRRFTPTAAVLFNLIATDLGRPLSDIKHNLHIADLEAQIVEVISTLSLKQQEVQDQTGRWYDLRIRPYRTLDDRIDGAVVILVEIDALKRSSDQLRAARDYAEAIVETVGDCLVVLDGDLRVVTANQRFYRQFGVTPGETEKSLIFDLGKGQWNIPPLRSLLHDLLPQNTQIDDFRIDYQLATSAPQTMGLNARKMTLADGHELILLAIRAMEEQPQVGQNGS